MRGAFHITRLSAAASLAASAMLALLLAAWPARVAAQTPQPIPVQPNIATLQTQGHVFKVGEPCKMMSGSAGLIKRDACQRWYCSRPGYLDITVRQPNFAAELGCHWQLVGTHCLCQPDKDRAKAK
jgi:hypothetical protein